MNEQQAKMIIVAQWKKYRIKKHLAMEYDIDDTPVYRSFSIMPQPITPIMDADLIELGMPRLVRQKALGNKTSLASLQGLVINLFDNI